MQRAPSWSANRCGEVAWGRRACGACGAGFVGVWGCIGCPLVPRGRTTREALMPTRNGNPDFLRRYQSLGTCDHYHHGRYPSDIPRGAYSDPHSSPMSAGIYEVGRSPHWEVGNHLTRRRPALTAGLFFSFSFTSTGVGATVPRHTAVALMPPYKVVKGAHQS